VSFRNLNTLIPFTTTKYLHTYLEFYSSVKPMEWLFCIPNIFLTILLLSHRQPCLLIRREMLDIPTLFFRIWFQTDVSQSYEIVTHFSWHISLELNSGNKYLNAQYSSLTKEGKEKNLRDLSVRTLSLGHCDGLRWYFLIFFANSSYLIGGPILRVYVLL
jgi:hypothetical protein